MKNSYSIAESAGREGAGQTAQIAGNEPTSPRPCPPSPAPELQVTASRRRKPGGPESGLRLDITPESDARFFDKVEIGDGCWPWCGARNQYGYGTFVARSAGKSHNVRAHRYAYQRLVGPIPSGLTLDHLCRNRACVRPDHLQAVTFAENLRRGVEARRARRVA